MKKILIILTVAALTLALSSIAAVQQTSVQSATTALRDQKGTVVGTAAWGSSTLTSTTGALTTLPVTGGEVNTDLFVAILSLGMALVMGGYLLRWHTSQTQ